MCMYEMGCVMPMLSLVTGVINIRKTTTFMWGEVPAPVRKDSKTGAVTTERGDDLPLREGFWFPEIT